jgi:hypothetical protein
MALIICNNSIVDYVLFFWYCVIKITPEDKTNLHLGDCTESTAIKSNTNLITVEIVGENGEVIACLFLVEIELPNIWCDLMIMEIMIENGFLTKMDMAIYRETFCRKSRVRTKIDTSNSEMFCK